jgi:hypothetical protein
MSRARPSSLEYGKSEVSGADIRGVGGGTGELLPKTPAQARAAAAARGEAAPRGKRGAIADAVARQTKRLVDETQQMQKGQNVDRDIERQKYLKGLPNQYFRKGGVVTNDYGKGKR